MCPLPSLSEQNLLGSTLGTGTNHGYLVRSRSVWSPRTRPAQSCHAPHTIPSLSDADGHRRNRQPPKSAHDPPNE